MRVVLATACLAIAGLALVALVEGDTAEEAPVDLAPPPETADPLPPLPPGWRRTANAEGGFALGVPPGWSVKPGRGRTTLRGLGGSVVVRVTADRSEAAVEAPLEEYAERLLAGLGGPQDARARAGPAQAGYEKATATGRRADGERLQVVVLRRPELAAFPLLVASDSRVRAAELDPIVAQLVGSLRGRPVMTG